MNAPTPTTGRLMAALLGLASACASAAPEGCRAQSGAVQPAVIELYTSEGCSSCPPADRWLSGLKEAAAQGRVVAQAFHVGYWDQLGWVDRFAAPAYTTRQRQIAQHNGLRSIYTPQIVRNGLDWREGATARALHAEAARASIVLQREGAESFTASVTPAEGVAAWSAYWTVTEHGHHSKVAAGENAGRGLSHDFVVRQYVQAGRYRGANRLTLQTVPELAAHPRQINLVVTDAAGRPLQALSLAC